jgi:acetyl-CoA carboxylase carboxyl transferase subunit alpha
MKITGPDLLGLKIVDQIIPEPIGGAHRHVAETMRAVADAIEANLAKMDSLDAAALRKKRRERFLAIGRLEAEAG